MRSREVKEAIKLGCPFTYNNPKDLLGYKCNADRCMAWRQDVLNGKGYCKLIETEEGI